MNRAIFVLGAMFGIALVVQCGGSATVANIADGAIGIDLAHAQQGSSVSQISCDKTTVINDNNYYYGELSGTGLSPSDAPHVSAILCSSQISACLGSSSCSGYAFPSGTCQQIAAFYISADKIIVRCNSSGDTAYVRVN